MISVAVLPGDRAEGTAAVHVLEAEFLDPRPEDLGSIGEPTDGGEGTGDCNS